MFFHVCLSVKEVISMSRVHLPYWRSKVFEESKTGATEPGFSPTIRIESWERGCHLARVQFSANRLPLPSAQNVLSTCNLR